MIAGLALLALTAAAGTAQGQDEGELLDSPVQVDGARSGPCFEAAAGAPGTTSFSIESPAYGYLRLELAGGSGDWDVAAFSAGHVVTAAASSGPSEVATGFVLQGERISVRVCRNAGAEGEPTVKVMLHQLPYPEGAAPQLLEVSTPEPADRAALDAAGLDVAEGAYGVSAEVLSRGPADLQALERTGLDYEAAKRPPGAGALNESTARRSTRRLPSGRSSYRRQFDYEQEMKALAGEYPDLVREFTLPEPSLEGRAIEAIELGDNPGAEEGEPVFLQMGLHHGREWPSGELALEWAYELLRSADAGDAQALRLLTDTKTIVVPVVSPDGFNLSREAGQLREDFGDRYGDERAGIPIQPEEFQRKNCRLPGPGRVGDCGAIVEQGAVGGVDINRNYGGMWGGSGGAPFPGDATYRGRAPFSEPETRNVRWIYSNNQVTASSSNHTFAALILRPPLVASAGLTPDEPLYRRVGERMGAHTGYPSEPGTALYDSSGGLEGWSYYATGSLDYTPEIDTGDFHGPFHRVVREWNGTGNRGGGMRAATHELAAFARNPSKHAVVSGQGPPSGRIVFRKAFETKTLPIAGRTKLRDPIRFDDLLESSVDVDADGSFTASLNPSTRPIALQRKRGPLREQWKLYCVDAAGQKTGKRKLYVERGDAIDLDLSNGC